MDRKNVPFVFICIFALKKKVDMELRFDWSLARYHIGRFLHHADDVRMPDNKICRS